MTTLQRQLVYSFFILVSVAFLVFVLLNDKVSDWWALCAMLILPSVDKPVDIGDSK